ncbi:YjcZ family sporulation protein [Bacillus sp. CLL-7-23]|uniref:YjcZ family sporulation protein n=1 Tax=Bacillus changyiensis TaxID=3004103 RepID=A0ABT4X2H1_9BACI|nr:MULTISPECIES: YjcZ family sporulation protein [Bacillus]MDA1475702.1 YjcZ family sporulation protein [Bacillus changyiensis]MDA7026307.1 YjcZ family sporulation protein [Bacillus changyiensis]NPC92414.1 YjcZ family sporulation protein [Bacillus sp. WMMC1349]
MYGYCCPGYGYGGYGYGGYGYGRTFALIVVLFILLIIVGAAYLGC